MIRLLFIISFKVDRQSDFVFLFKDDDEPVQQRGNISKPGKKLTCPRATFVAEVSCSACCGKHGKITMYPDLRTFGMLVPRLGIHLRIIFAFFFQTEVEIFDEEVCEHHIPWLARHLNKDVEKVARLLGVDSDEIDAIKQGELVETRNIRILDFWRRETLRSRKTPTWNQIKSVLESETVRRFDVIRALRNEEEISKDVFLWLEQRGAAVRRNYARLLGVPGFEIDMISESSHRCEEKCAAVLQRWRQRTRSPTIEQLIEALEHDTIKKNELAKEMREMFCQR
jgi:hypothetical protein